MTATTSSLFVYFLWLFVSFQCFGQDQDNDGFTTLSGVIVDVETGERLPGATVKYANANVGVVSNQYGFFSLTNQKGSRKAISIAKYAEFYPPPQMNFGAQVRMYSVNSEIFDFYKSLISQFDNDGGAYAPTPAMPRGNISGNGIGLFRAFDESSASVYYK